MSIDKLPIELLNHVFSYMDSPQHLAQCRLVCKSLNRPAERAMFGVHNSILSLPAAKAFLYHLNNGKEMGKLIKSLHLNTEINILLLAITMGRDTSEYLELLSLVFTPSMRSFHGMFEAPELFKRMMELASASNTSFDKLKRIPDPSPDCMYHYYKALFYFKTTLQHVGIYEYTDEVPWEIFHHLGKFINLTSLQILDGIHSVPNCTQLLELEVSISDKTEDAWETDSMLAWMNTHVEKGPTLTKFAIVGSRQPEIVDYLLYKYFNVAEANVYFGDGNDIYYDLWAQEMDTRSIQRIINTLQILPLYRLHSTTFINPTSLTKVKELVEVYYYQQHLQSALFNYGHRDRNHAKGRSHLFSLPEAIHTRKPSSVIRAKTTINNKDPSNIWEEIEVVRDKDTALELPNDSDLLKYKLAIF